MALIKTKTRLGQLIAEHRPTLSRFFEGRLYPALVALAVLIGHITALELFFAAAILIAASIALTVCDSAKPFIPTLLTFVYIVTLKHTPGMPNWSDYYTRLYVLIPIGICFVLLAAALVYFTVRVVVPRFKAKSAPMLLPVSILSAAFLLNGAFSSGWKIGSLLFGIGEVLVFFFLFYLFYYGLWRESTSELLDYITYIALLIAMVLVGEVAFLFATSDALISDTGAIVKEQVLFGWGAWNPMGFSLAVIIPLLVRGAAVCKYRFVYLAAAIVTWGSAVLTMSRNALIFATLGLGLSILAAAIFAPREKRRLFVWVIIVGVAGAALGGVLFFDKISNLLADFINRGFSDNGRYELWVNSFENFKKSPIFGRGFFDWGEMDVFESATFVPTMSHNTLFQLLSSMGAVGTLAYGYYRVSSAAPFIKKFSFDKAMLLLSLLITLGASLLDNFIFYIYTAFLYTVILAIAFRMKDAESAEQTDADA